MKLTKTEQRILGFLVSQIGGDSSVIATKRQIAENVRCDVKTVDHAVRRMRQGGLLRSEPRYTEQGGQLGNVYFVAVSEVRDEIRN